MKHNVQTASYRDYGTDRRETKPRTELAPFHRDRRIFIANFQYSRKHYDQGTGRYYRNGRFINVYDAVTGTPIAVRGKGTNTDHIWIKDHHWLDPDWPLTDIDEMQKVSFIGKVKEYTTPQKDFTDYGLVDITDPINWHQYDQNMDILAEYEAGCPDIPHYSPEFSTFIPNLGNGQNPNSDDSEIPMSH